MLVGFMGLSVNVWIDGEGGLVTGWIWRNIKFWVFAPVLLWFSSKPVRKPADSRCAVLASESTVSAVTADRIMRTVFLRSKPGGEGGRVCVGGARLSVSSISTGMTL
jgi:hypothetical protein